MTQRTVRTILADEMMPGGDEKILQIVWVVDREPMPDKERYIQAVTRRITMQFELALREALGVL
jgi:hypothetical protein